MGNSGKCKEMLTMLEKGEVNVEKAGLNLAKLSISEYGLAILLRLSKPWLSKPWLRKSWKG